MIHNVTWKYGTRNEGGDAHLPTFYFLGRFVANLKRFLMSETKIGLKIVFEPPSTRSIAEFSINYFPPYFFYPKHLLHPRGISRICLRRRVPYGEAPWRRESGQDGRFGRFRTKRVSQGVLTATGPPGYHFKHLFGHFSTTALPARTRAAKMAKKHVRSWKA